MVKHIVTYPLKDGVEKDAAVRQIASVLEPLVGKIPGLLRMEIRRCFQGMDYILYSELESRDALAALEQELTAQAALLANAEEVRARELDKKPMQAQLTQQITLLEADLPRYAQLEKQKQQKEALNSLG